MELILSCIAISTFCVIAAAIEAMSNVETQSEHKLRNNKRNSRNRQ